MGLASQLRQTFIDAQAYAVTKSEYQAKLKKWQEGDKKDPVPTALKIDLKMEALQPYLRG
jgi:hypothetical protein